MDLFECESIFTIPFAISHLAQKSRKRDKGELCEGGRKQ